MEKHQSSIQDWTIEQARIAAGDWMSVITKFYPQYIPMWADPQEHYRALLEEWNYLDAVKVVDWVGIFNRCSPNKILDLGAGTGWLSAFLSTFAAVKTVDTLDISRGLLNLIPEIALAMNGDLGKIRPILGAFYPLLAEDATYDMIVVSSALHHAPNLYSALYECNRVLKNGGVLLILNETPDTSLQYCWKFLKFVISAALHVITGNYPENSSAVSKSGILVDPYLGDHAYSYSQWRQALDKTGFSMHIMKTTFFPSKTEKRQARKLFHFICEKKLARSL